MSASYDPNHVTKLGELYSLVTGIWTKCKNLFATKSEVPSKTSDLQNDSGFITSSDIPAQQQANWNESDNTKPSFIQNKPTIPTVPTTDQTYNASSTNPQSGTAVAGAIANVKQVPASTSADEGKVLKVDSSGNPEWGAAPASQVQADWTESDSSDPSYIQNKPVEQTLVAGTNITITEANNQVTIGASFTQAQADWNQSDSAAADYIKNKPSIPAAQVQSDWSQSDNTQVDFIKNKPSIPTVDQTYNASSVNAQSGTAVAGAIANVKQVPASVAADEGKILTVDSSGNPAWDALATTAQIQAIVV